MLTASAAQATDKTPCGTNMICASVPTTVGAAMMRAGYQGLIGKDPTGDPKIDSAAGGYRFTVFFYGCERNRDCDSLQFFASFDGDPARGAAFANKWNSENRFGQMSIRADNSIVLNYDVSTIGGLNQANFADVLDWWSTMLGAFDKFTAANPLPGAAGKSTTPTAPARPRS